MSRVFLAEPNGRYDLTAAREFGDIVYLSDQSMNPFDTATVVDKLETALIQAGFKPDEDYICMTGQSLTVAMLLAVAAATYPMVRLLMFDARGSNYRERVFSAGDPGESLSKEAEVA